MEPDALRAHILTSWLTPVARRVIRLDRSIHAVIYALARDGDEVVEDFVPVVSLPARWPECFEDNPWLEEDSDEAEALDDALMDACEELDGPSPADLAAAWGDTLPPEGPDGPVFVPVALATPKGARPWEERAPRPSGG